MGLSKREMIELNNVCSYVSERIGIDGLTLDNYVSTENMISNKEGIFKSSGLPKTNAVRYRKGDVLISNIRPYFKKIWSADREGGCSADVLNFRANEKYNPKFLYYVLSDDEFFRYSVGTSRGTKMPRGDKAALLKYSVPKISMDEQERIVEILSALDDKIKLNKKVNDNLEQQLQVIFLEMFGTFIESLPENQCQPLGDLVNSIDNRGKTPPLAINETEYPIIDVKALSGSSRIVDYNNCTKYVESDTYNNWFRSGHPKPMDILISTVGSLAEMKLFLGSKGCVAQNVVAFRSRDISPLYLYQYLTTIKKDLVAYNIGSVQPSIKVTHIIKHLIYIPTKVEVEKYNNIADAMTNQIYQNCLEAERLVQLRDTLLPRFMSGELDVSNIDIKETK